MTRWEKWSPERRAKQVKAVADRRARCIAKGLCRCGREPIPDSRWCRACKANYYRRRKETRDRKTAALVARKAAAA
jgi:hypothetical protein